MRFFIKNIINQDDKKNLVKYYSSTRGSKLSVKNCDNLIIQKIVSEMAKHCKFTIKNESYFIIERRPEGHPWHIDTGTENHMSWCEVGGTILLTNEFTGGELVYQNRIGQEEIIQDRAMYDLYFHTSDEMHKINPSVGERMVLLLFI